MQLGTAGVRGMHGRLYNLLRTSTVSTRFQTRALTTGSEEAAGGTSDHGELEGCCQEEAAAMEPVAEPSSASMRDMTAAVVVDKEGNVCRTPRDLKTDLLNFLNQSDIQKRKRKFDIPLFTSGSYLAVTRADPLSSSGTSKFVGICIARTNKGLGSIFTLRNVINGMGVEMMFELYSPKLKEIQVLKLERRRKAKLYYLREKPPQYSTVDENMEPVPNDGVNVPVYKRGKGEPA